MVASAGAVSAVYLVTGLVSLSFVLPALRNREKPGSTGFLVAVTGISLWSLQTGLAVEFLTGTTQLVAAFQFKLLCAGLTTAGWLLLAVEVTEWRPLSRRLVVAVAAPLVVAQTLVWTNPWHNLVLLPGTTVRGGLLYTALGPAYWAHWLLTYGLVAAGVALMLREVFRTTGVRRTQTAVLLAAAVPPVLFNLVSVSDVVLAQYDLTVFGFVGSELVLAWALFGARFLDIVPVARRTVVEEMADAVVIVDGEGAIVDFNAAAGELLDLTDADIGTPARATCADRIGRPDLLTTTDDEISVTTDGQTRYFDLDRSSLDGAPSGRGGTALVFREVTDRKAAEQERRTAMAELERQNERLDRFASTVSHDLRNPLRTAQSNLEMARHEVDSPLLDDVAAAHDRMDDLVDDLLTLARQGQTVDSPEPVSIEAVADDAAAQVRTDGVDIEIRDDTTVEADPDRLQELFENLYRNTAEHATGGERADPDHAADGSGATVRVDTHEEGFFVADDGPGIPADEREDVFEYGYSTDSDGTGFGLAIVEEIAEAHGWEVAVTDSQWGGARFEVAT